MVVDVVDVGGVVVLVVEVVDALVLVVDVVDAEVLVVVVLPATASGSWMFKNDWSAVIEVLLVYTRILQFR